jgi:hypothetical protein
MKQAIAFLALVLTLAFGACSSKSGSTKARLTTCDPNDSGKIVHLQANSYEPGGRVVRLAAH